MLVGRKPHLFLECQQALAVVGKQRNGRVGFKYVENRAKGVQPLGRTGKIAADKVLFKNIDVVLFQNKLVTLVRYALGKRGFLVVGDVKHNALNV